MRISISGTQNTGKSTLVKDFLKEWPMYELSSFDYRSLIETRDSHSKNTSEEVQWKILNGMIDDLQNMSEHDYVIFDRCPLDNLVYSMWKNSKDTNAVSDKFVSKSIQLVREALKLLDVIFFIPLTKHAPDIPIEDDGKREIDPVYREEIDNIFKSISHEWTRNPNFKLCDPEDKPPIIEIFGKPLERIEMLKMYINTDGDVIGGTGDMSSILDIDDLKQIETLKEGLGVGDDDVSKAFQDTI